MKDRNGFMSISIIYSFLILFLILMFSIIISYSNRINMVNSLVDKSKEEIKNHVSDFDEVKAINKPALVVGMTPVKWNDSYVESTTTADDPDWYDYSQKKWANVKTVDDSYWVWIPRYAYKITNGIHTGGVGISGTIDIKFLIGKTNTALDGTTIETTEYNYEVKDTSTSYFLHSAFTFGDDELTGIWVAKFEASVGNTSDLCYTNPNATRCNNTTLVPAFKSNVNSWRYIQIGNMFDVAYNLKSKTDYGWAGTGIDTHLIKNTEWGAVTYLAQSIYGANQEIWINNSNTFTTGCAGDSASTETLAACYAAYNTSGGVKASTTHNITGVYDMSGGAFEYTAAYVDNGNAGTNGQLILNALDKYRNKYAMGTTDTQGNNYTAAEDLYGDAVYESSSTFTGSASWYYDYSYMPTGANCWFRRGGRYDDSTSAGLIGFHRNSGAANAYHGFRAVALIP